MVSMTRPNSFKNQFEIYLFVGRCGEHHIITDVDTLLQTLGGKVDCFKRSVGHQLVQKRTGTELFCARKVETSSCVSRHNLANHH